MDHSITDLKGNEIMITKIILAKCGKGNIENFGMCPKQEVEIVQRDHSI